MASSHGIVDQVEQAYPDYLHDESRRTGRADSISFPRTEEEIREILVELAAQQAPVTIQGARTGITGGAVPEGGHILNLSRMNRILGFRDPDCLAVQPGVLLAEVQEHLKGSGFFFAPDPTETSASLGGMVSCNASGARSFHYGATRDHVVRVRVMLMDGSILDLRRGQVRTRGRTFSLDTDTGRVVAGSLPAYDMPHVKSAAGYFSQDDMDLVDLFIGAEGTLGIVTEIEVQLVSRPGALWGVLCFLPSELAAIRFVVMMRNADHQPTAMEFFDAHALDLLRGQKQTNPAFKNIPDIPSAWHSAVYVDVQGDSGDAVEEAVMGLSEMMVTCGGDEDATWLATDEKEMRRLKDFRHAVPEAVNLTIDERRKQEPMLTKLGTDLAVPDQQLEQVLALYHEGLQDAGLDYVMFGHIGNNHLHVNILPRTQEDYQKGKALYLHWARAVVDMGGTVSAEHGIGKLKKEMLAIMFGETGIEEMRALKRLFDPEDRLNPGNWFIGED